MILSAISRSYFRARFSLRVYRVTCANAGNESTQSIKPFENTALGKFVVYQVQVGLNAAGYKLTSDELSAFNT